MLNELLAALPEGAAVVGSENGVVDTFIVRVVVTYFTFVSMAGL
jgi:hypothetical protein